MQFFPPDLRVLLAKVSLPTQAQVTEIRLRCNRPIELILDVRSGWLAANGEVGPFKDALALKAGQLQNVVNAMTVGSFYALEESIAQGFLALPGGHRVGLTGRIVCEKGQIRSIRDISGLNFRIAKAVRGIARPVLPFIWNQMRLLKTLILAPPAAGKTTLLREIVREVSNGVPELGLSGMRVGLVDERSEIAGSFQGEPQLDVGYRTDVLDGCPKKAGVYLLLRAMNPQLIATDEIGTLEDFQVIEDIVNTGVSFIATAHARNLTEAIGRPGLRQIMEAGMVERLIFMSKRLGVGTIETIKAGVSGPELLTEAFRPEGKNG